MNLKYIIVAVLILVGIVFGAYNWISYFKKSQGAARPAIQAVRPVQKAGENLPQEKAASPAQNQTVVSSTKQDTGSASSSLPEIPDTVGRNPFLTPSEIAAIARGESVEPAFPVIPPVALSLPAVKLTGLIHDNIAGSYRAIIDGRIYEKGDTLGEEKIVEITGNSVVLQSAGGSRTIGLEEKEKRQGVKARSIRVKENP
jgi:hypothetical protein